MPDCVSQLYHLGLPNLLWWLCRSAIPDCVSQLHQRGLPGLLGDRVDMLHGV